MKSKFTLFTRDELSRIRSAHGQPALSLLLNQPLLLLLIDARDRGMAQVDLDTGSIFVDLARIDELIAFKKNKDTL